MGTISETSSMDSSINKKSISAVGLSQLPEGVAGILISVSHLK